MLPACLLLLGLILAAAGEVHITELKVPNAVKEGEDAELRCEYSPSLEVGDNIKLWFTPLSDGDKKETRYLRFGNSKGQALHPENRVLIKENDTIQIVNMQTSDSGVYECEVSHRADEDRRSAKLVVYTTGTGPQLNPNITIVQSDFGEEVALVTCNADGVFPEPQLNISIEGIEQEPNSSLTSSELVFKREAGLYDIEANVTVSDSNQQFTAVCQLSYTDPDVPVEPLVRLQYGTGGDDLTAAEKTESTTEAWVTTTTATDIPDGSTVLHWSWVSLLAAAALAHALTPHVH